MPRRFRVWAVISAFGEELRRFPYAEKNRAETFARALNERVHAIEKGFHVQPRTIEVSDETSSVKM